MAAETKELMLMASPTNCTRVLLSLLQLPAIDSVRLYRLLARAEWR
jgi:hypothetical protein